MLLPNVNNKKESFSFVPTVQTRKPEHAAGCILFSMNASYSRRANQDRINYQFFFSNGLYAVNNTTYLRVVPVSRRLTRFFVFRCSFLNRKIEFHAVQSIFDFTFPPPYVIATKTRRTPKIKKRLEHTTYV